MHDRCTDGEMVVTLLYNRANERSIVRVDNHVEFHHVLAAQEYCKSTLELKQGNQNYSFYSILSLWKKGCLSRKKRNS